MTKENSIKICNNCKYAKKYLVLTKDYYEIHCMLWDMAYSKTDRCGQYTKG